MPKLKFETLLSKYFKEKKSDSKAKTISAMISILEANWFSNMNNPLLKELEAKASEPHEFLFLGYFHFYLGNKLTSLENFAKSISLLNLSESPFIAQFLFTELLKPEFRPQKKFDSLKKFILQHLLKKSDFETSFLFVIESNLHDSIPIFFQASFTSLYNSETKSTTSITDLYKSIFYIISRPEFPETSQALQTPSIVSQLISYITKLPYKSSPSLSYLLLKCYLKKSLYNKIASFLLYLISHSATIKTALQFAFDLSETEPAYSLNTIKAHLIETQIKQKRNLNLFNTLIKIIPGDHTNRLTTIYVKNSAVSEKSTYSAVKNLTEYFKQANLFSIASYSLSKFSTGDMNFLNNRIKWLSKKTNWEQFVVTSCLGNIFRNTSLTPISLLTSLLTQANLKAPIQANPLVNSDKNNFNSNSESEGSYYLGGVLQAVGIASFDKPINRDFPLLSATLMNYLNSANGITRYGASISVGLLLSQNDFICLKDDSININKNNFVKQFKSIQNDLISKITEIFLEDDFEVSGGAALSLGFIFSSLNLSNFKETQNLLLQQLNKTEHSSVKRGIALALSFMSNNQNFNSNSYSLIKSLLSNNDEYHRLAGVLSIAMSYSNTSFDNQFSGLDLLLNALQTESNEDIIFFIMLGISLVLSNQPEEICNVLDLNSLPKHFSLKYKMGACIGLGVSACCSNDAGFIEKVIKVLKSLRLDNRRIVRNAAYVGLGLATVNSNFLGVETDQCFDYVLLNEDIKEVVRLGGILGFGIKRAGGQTAGIFCNKKNNFGVKAGILFLGMSYKWFPYLSLIGLCFENEYSADIGFETIGEGDSKEIKLKLLNKNVSLKMEERGGVDKFIFYGESVKAYEDEIWPDKNNIDGKEDNKGDNVEGKEEKKEERTLTNLQRVSYIKENAGKSNGKENREEWNDGKESGVVIVDLKEIKDKEGNSEDGVFL